MLRVEDVHVVRHKVLVEGLSRRQVAREMGISRNTVRRYLRLAEPVRVERELRRKPVLERVQPRLDALLEEWSGRTTAKQRLTATRLHRQLREEGFYEGRSFRKADVAASVADAVCGLLRPGPARDVR